jgi:hypothetical protein
VTVGRFDTGVVLVLAPVTMATASRDDASGDDAHDEGEQSGQQRRLAG